MQVKQVILANKWTCWDLSSTIFPEQERMRFFGMKQKLDQWK